MPPADNRVVMPIIVVNEAEGEVVVFGGEAEGVFGEDVAVGDAGGAGSAADGAEGGVIVMGGDAVLKCVAEYLGEVLVAVVGVEEIEIPILGAHDERFSCLLIVHAAAKAVEGHCDDRVAELPADGAVFGIVND